MLNKLKKVYELEGLVCDLYVYFTVVFGSILSILKLKVIEFFFSIIFDYEFNLRYVWIY